MILDILQYDFMQRAILAGLIIGVISPIIGTFLVLRRLSFIGDTLSHTTLAGVAAGVLLGIYPVFTGMVFAVFAAFGIEQLRKVYKHYEELSMPIMLSTGIGLAVVLISLANGFTVDLFSYLFGSVIAVTKTDIISITILGSIIVVTVILLYKELLFISFDEESARLSGIRYKTVNLVFTILVALTIAVSMRIVGILLVSSMMTIPVAASLQEANSFKQAITFSVIYAEISIILGLLSAYYFNVASGGAIVLVSVVLLLITLLYKKLRY